MGHSMLYSVNIYYGKPGRHTREEKEENGKPRVERKGLERNES